MFTKLFYPALETSFTRLLRTAKMDYKCHKTWNICIQIEDMSLKERGVVDILHGRLHTGSSGWGKFRKSHSVTL